MSRIAIVLLTMVLLTSCSDSDSTESDGVTPTPAASVSLAPSPTVSATPGPYSLPRARAAYLALVTASNRARATAYDAWDRYAARETPQRLAEVRRTALRMAAANRTFSLGLQRIRWPASVQTLINRMVELLAKDRSIWLELSGVESASDFNQAVEKFQPTAAETSDLIRQKLGLPTAVLPSSASPR